MGMLINILPKEKMWNPLSLVSRNMEVVMNEITKGTMFKSIGVTTIMTVALIVMAVVIFKKKQLYDGNA